MPIGIETGSGMLLSGTGVRTKCFNIRKDKMTPAMKSENGKSKGLKVERTVGVGLEVIGEDV